MFEPRLTGQKSHLLKPEQPLGRLLIGKAKLVPFPPLRLAGSGEREVIGGSQTSYIALFPRKLSLSLVWHHPPRPLN